MTDHNHERPAGVEDATVAAVGKVTEALEWVERARGHLYEFHHQIGHADLTFGQAADDLEAAGHPQVAETLRRDLVGRNVLPGRWTFEVVEEFDDDYHQRARNAEEAVRRSLLESRRHVHEAELKDREQAPHHR